jgi:hypothetical protein
MPIRPPDAVSTAVAQGRPAPFFPAAAWKPENDQFFPPFRKVPPRKIKFRAIS